MTGGARHTQGLVVRMAEGEAKDIMCDGGGGGGDAGRVCPQEVGGEALGEVQEEVLEGPLLLGGGGGRKRAKMYSA